MQTCGGGARAVSRRPTRPRARLPGRPEMSSRLVALCFDANDPLHLARFWAHALRWDVEDQPQGEIGLVPTDGTRFAIRFLPVTGNKAGANRIHLDLTTTSIDDQHATVAELIELG